MGEEFLEIEYKFLLITLDKIMKTDDLYQLKSMFSHATDRIELIFRTRYKNLLEKATKKIAQGHMNSVYDISGFTYMDTDSIKVEKEDKTNETTNS